MKKIIDDEFEAEFKGDKYTERGTVKIIEGIAYFKDEGRLFGNRPITNRVLNATFYETYVKKSHTGDTGVEIRIYNFDTSGKNGKFKFGAEIESRINNIVRERNALKVENAELKDAREVDKSTTQTQDYMNKLFGFVKTIRDKIFIPPKDEGGGK